MIFVDTHSHLYVEQFDDDRTEVVEAAIRAGVQYIILPHIDSSYDQPLQALCRQFPENCFPLAGLHPTSVKKHYKEDLNKVEALLHSGKYYGIGETGIDLYWEKTYAYEQNEAFRFQIQLAKKHKLPLVIHQRASFHEIMKILKTEWTSEMKGIFHCFSGDLAQAQNVIEMGFLLGIGGVVTFKNSNLKEIIAKVDLKHIVLETDSPYLAPVPKRGKRNESSYIVFVAQKIAEIKNLSVRQVAEATTENALQVFNIPRKKQEKSTR